MNELKIIFAIATLERPTRGSIAEHSGCGTATVERVIKRIQQPFPEGFGMNLSYQGDRWEILDWGELESSKMMNKTLASS